jgi:hypothetical protein
MKKLTKILLGLTITGLTLGILFAAGVVQAGDAVGWYMLLPGGAICFGVFLISYMLEKEVALFDAEQESRFSEESELSPERDAEVHPSLSAKHAH